MTRDQFISKWGNRGGRPLFDASVEFTNDLDEFLSEDINLLEARTRRTGDPSICERNHAIDLCIAEVKKWQWEIPSKTALVKELEALKEVLT